MMYNDNYRFCIGEMVQINDTAYMYRIFDSLAKELGLQHFNKSWPTFDVTDFVYTVVRIVRHPDWCPQAPQVVVGIEAVINGKTWHFLIDQTGLVSFEDTDGLG